jgi:TPR repeat protein
MTIASYRTIIGDEGNIPPALVAALTTGGRAEVDKVLADLRASGCSLPSFVFLGVICELGLFGVPVNPGFAFDWYTRSANEENDSEGFFGIARLHLSGAAAVKNVPLAVEFFKGAAERGSIEAATILGFLFYKGFWVIKDLQSAEHYLSRG